MRGAALMYNYTKQRDSATPSCTDLLETVRACRPHAGPQSANHFGEGRLFNEVGRMEERKDMNEVKEEEYESGWIGRKKSTGVLTLENLAVERHSPWSCGGRRVCAF